MWRPFIVSVSKIEGRQGITSNMKKFELSHGSIRELFAILSSFYNFMLYEEYVELNPIALIRQKSKFIRKKTSPTKNTAFIRITMAVCDKDSESINRAKP